MRETITVSSILGIPSPVMQIGQDFCQPCSILKLVGVSTLGRAKSGSWSPFVNQNMDPKLLAPHAPSRNSSPLNCGLYHVDRGTCASRHGRITEELTPSTLSEDFGPPFWAMDTSPRPQSSPEADERTPEATRSHFSAVPPARLAPGRLPVASASHGTTIQ